MRSEVFNNVYSRVVRLLGRDPSTASMTDAQSASIVDRINAAVREGWEYAMWPEVVEVEERAFRTVYSATQAYVSGNEVYYSAGDAYYVCIQDATGKDPATETAYWTLIDSADFDYYLPYAPTGAYPLGEVIGVYDANPDQDEDYSEWDWSVTNTGIQVRNCGETKVWVKYRMRPPTFNRTAKTGSESLGDIIYDASSGECYQAQLDSDGSPIFVKLDLPWILSEFVTYAAFADMLIEDGQYDKWGIMRRKAADELERSYVTVFGQQGIAERVEWRV